MSFDTEFFSLYSDMSNFKDEKYPQANKPCNSCCYEDCFETLFH